VPEGREKEWGGGKRVKFETDPATEEKTDRKQEKKGEKNITEKKKTN